MEAVGTKSRIWAVVIAIAVALAMFVPLSDDAFAAKKKGTTPAPKYTVKAKKGGILVGKISSPKANEVWLKIQRNGKKGWYTEKSNYYDSNKPRAGGFEVSTKEKKGKYVRVCLKVHDSTKYKKASSWTIKKVKVK